MKIILIYLTVKNIAEVNIAQLKLWQLNDNKLMNLRHDLQVFLPQHTFAYFNKLF